MSEYQPGGRPRLQASAVGPAAQAPAAIAGTWRAEDPATAFLTFSTPAAGAGHMTGSDGCNGVNGEYTLQGDTATITRGFSTLKACLGVDTWLAGTTAVTVAGDTLRVFDSHGEEIGTLRRER